MREESEESEESEVREVREERQERDIGEWNGSMCRRPSTRCIAGRS